MSAEFKVIIVPVDGSEGSQRAARFAASLAKATGRKMKLIYVFPANPSEIMGLSQLPQKEVESVKKESARKVFDKAQQAIGGGQGEVEEQILFGDPAEEIIRCADGETEPLIVMGRRGLSRVKSLLLGSVSEKVMRHASAAVTIVH